MEVNTKNLPSTDYCHFQRTNINNSFLSLKIKRMLYS